MRYAVAVFSVLAATLLTAGISYWVPNTTMTVPAATIFFAAIVISTWWGGLWPGVVATAISVLLIEYAIVAPTNNSPWTPLSFVRVGSFLCVALLVNSLYAARQRAENALSERARLANFAARIGRGIVETRSLSDLLQKCVESITGELDVWAAGIWIPEETNSEGRWIQRASAESFTTGKQDTPKSRTYPIQVEERLLGRLTISFPGILSLETHHALEMASYEIALGIERWQTAQALAQQSEELEIALRNAELAIQAKTDFIASIGHEVRTPLNGVIGLTRLLLDSELTGEQRQMARGVRDAGQAILTVINDLLDVSRLEAGKLSLERTAFDLRLVVEQTIELLAPSAQEKGISLFFRFSPAAPRYLWGDAGRIRQVLTNLISNAIKFTETGHVYVDVDCGDKDAEIPLLLITVEDTGIGIAEEELPLIFERFNQGSADTSRKYGGSGLGLAISHQLIEMMNGKIEVQSRVGVGSTFTVSLRLPRSVAQEAQREQMPYVDLRGTSIIVADENHINRAILHEQLTSWGMRVSSHASGGAALQDLRSAALESTPYHIALVDFSLSDMRAQDLAREVMIDPSLQQTRLVLLAPISRVRRLVREAEEAGFNGILTKPVRPSQLMDALAGALYAPEDARQTSTGEPSRNMGFVVAGALARILVVEDNAINQALTRRELERMGYQVEIAENGREAIQLLDMHYYDVILMDCQMPIMDGFEATREIRRREEEVMGTPGTRRIPIIAVSADMSPETRDRCLAVGMDDFLGKPVDPDQLAEAITRVTTFITDTEQPNEIQPDANQESPTPTEAALPPPTMPYLQIESWEIENLPERFRKDPDGLRLAADLLHAEYPRLTLRLNRAVLSANFDESARTAHAIKGVVMYFEAETAIAAAQRVEFAARAQDETALAPAANDLIAALESLSATLTEAVARLDSL